MFAINTPGNVLTMNGKFNEISNFKIVEKEQLYDWVVVPVFGTETSEEKAIKAGVITVPDVSKIEGDEETETELEDIIEGDEGEDELEEEESYLSSMFAGTTLVMNILLVILAIIFFTCMISLLIMCRRCVN